MPIKSISAKKPERLRHIFRKWLLVLVMVAYAVTFLAIDLTQKRHAEKTAGLTIATELRYFSNQISVNELHSHSLKREASEDMIAKAWALSVLIRENHAFLTDRAFQRDMLKKLELESFYISDKNGEVICSFPADYEHHFNFHDYETTRPYLQLIGTDHGSIAEEPRPRDKNLAGDDKDSLQQFAGVPRLDSPGIVQVAYSDKQYDLLLHSVSVEHLCDGYSVGEKGFLMLFDRNKLISATNDDVRKIPLAAVQPPSGNTPSYNVTINGSAYLAGSIRTGNYLLIAAEPYSEIYSTMYRIMIWTASFFFLLFAAVFFEVSNLLDRLVVKNIDKTNDSLKKITDGDLEEQVNANVTEEFSSLSTGINATVHALKKAISDAAERIDKELEFAHAIQISALPKLIPSFQGTNGFDLYADMHPAKEVGGDFYDFFMLGSDRLAIVIADVSGKGIPAALFMMTAKAQLRNHVESIGDLAKACTAANRALCEGNDAQMFVTVFTGILDLRTGVFTYVNAGHNPPLIRHEGKYDWLRSKSGIFMGSFDTIQYKQFSMQLSKGDMVLLYTDGVTEAMDHNGKLYGEKRFETHLNSIARLCPRVTVQSVYGALAAYAAGAPQSDDITMLAVQYKPGLSNSGSNIFPATLESLDGVQSFIADPLEKRMWPEPVRKQLAVAVEELFVNVAHYAYSAPGGTAEIRWSYTDDPACITVTMSDSGKPFNPLTRADPVKPESIAEAKIGGLGILMAKKDTDSMTYEYRDGKNILTFTKRRDH